jgi:hypothetical protein
MTINNKYAIGQIVYLTTDTEQKQRLIVGILIYPSTIKYIVCSGENETSHYDMEISATKNILI